MPQSHCETLADPTVLNAINSATQCNVYTELRVTLSMPPLFWALPCLPVCFFNEIRAFEGLPNPHRQESSGAMGPGGRLLNVKVLFWLICPRFVMKA